MMTANDEFAVIFIKSHASDITFKTVFEASCRLTCLSIPNIDRPLTSNVELKSNFREKST
jgi:hypothetical protein